MAENNLKKVCFYVVAHADDWQLFMFPNVYNDIVAENKTVFIITTAGDAGKEEKYWRAREEGAKSSLRFCIAPLKNFTESDGWREFNNHPVYYWYTDNSIFYFLRLPDGNIDGCGFSTYNFESLLKLESTKINSITAVDNSTTYNSWEDFCATLKCIIDNESNDLEQWINYINPDISLNPIDHADHGATGRAIERMNFNVTNNQIKYSGYNAGNTTHSINENDLFWKIGMFAAYEKAVFDNSGYSTLREDAHIYIKWCLDFAHFITVKENIY